MSGYPNRVPPIKLMLDKDYYNNLIQVLVNNEKCSDEIIRNEATKLKKKLLTYSVPRENEGIIEIDARFYNNEASQLFYQFMYFNKDFIDVKDDYLNILKETRSNRFNKKDE